MIFKLNPIFVKFSILSLYCLGVAEILGKNILLTTLGCLLAIPYVLYKIYENQLYFNKYFVALFFMLVCGATINLIMAPNGMGGVIVVMGTLSLSVFILDNPSKILVHAFYLILLTIGFLAYKLFYLKLPPNLLYEGYSRNYPGFLLVVFNVFYLFLLFIVKRKVSIVIVVVSLILSFFLVGRSSIGVLGLLLVTVLLFHFKMKSFKWRAAMCLVLILIFIRLLPLIQELYLLSSFSDVGLETSRYDIWRAYFKHLTPLNFIFGTNLFEIPIVAKHSGNLHNSFFNLQARTGIGFIALIATLIIAIYSYFKSRKFFELMLLIAFSIRLFFDANCFIGNMDFVYYAILMYPLYNTCCDQFDFKKK